MTPEIEKIVKKCTFREIRKQSDHHFEGVVETETVPALHKQLTEYFGSPCKPKDEKPSRRANKIAAPYGGIRKGQTMYLVASASGQGYDLAMLWPWGDGLATTLKIFSDQSIPEPSGNGFFQRMFLLGRSSGST